MVQGHNCSRENNLGNNCVIGAQCIRCDYNYPTMYPTLGVGSGIEPGEYYNNCGVKYGGFCMGNGDPHIFCRTLPPAPLPKVCKQRHAPIQPAVP